MSDNFYTTKTASLKATKADIRNLDAKQIKLNGKPIPSKVLDDRGDFVTDQDLWGTSITADENGVVRVSHKFLSNPNGIKAWNSSVKSVKDNKAYTSTDASGEPLCNIQTEMIKDGSYMFSQTPLASFTGDLSNLVNGHEMFRFTDLTLFTEDLSNLVDGHEMFSQTPLASFSGDLSNLVDGLYMFRSTNLTSFTEDLSNLVNGSSMFFQTPLTSFSGDLSSLVDAHAMFYEAPLASFTGDLSNLVNGHEMFRFTDLTLFTGDLSNLVNGYRMFYECKLSPQSVMYIVESIKNLKEEKAKYTIGEIPWVIYDSTTQKYSAPSGFMESGKYVYTYTTTGSISSSNVGKLTLGIDVTNDSATIDQQLKTFAEGCFCDSWAELKQEFVDKGWTVTFQYGGSSTSITLSEDEQFRGVPVYARLIEVSDEDKDMAEYCTEDGTKFYNIDWGHDVTDYDQYQYFGSLLEACGYFGVISKKYLEEA